MLRQERYASPLFLAARAQAHAFFPCSPHGCAADAGIGALFAPPMKLLCKTSLVDARAEAKRQARFLLVNIQSDAVFASHLLNRDVFKDELVEGLVLSGFVFWQAQYTVRARLLGQNRGRPCRHVHAVLPWPLAFAHFVVDLVRHAILPVARCPRPAPIWTGTATASRRCRCSPSSTRARSGSCGATRGPSTSASWLPNVRAPVFACGCMPAQTRHEKMTRAVAL